MAYVDNNPLLGDLNQAAAGIIPAMELLLLKRFSIQEQGIKPRAKQPR